MEKWFAVMGEPQKTYTNHNANQVYEYLRIKQGFSTPLRCVNRFAVDKSGKILDY